MGCVHSVEEIFTPENLSGELRRSGFSDNVIQAFQEKDIGGKAFLDLKREDFEKMQLEPDPIKKLEKFQKKYQIKVSVRLLWQ